jgi:5-dehydro-2-deoxygluconokinase
MVIDAVVIGRVGVDLGPASPHVALEDVERFGRSVGGYGGNVATGLARLRVRTAIVATVGDDGHGRFARRFLERERVDTSGLRSDPSFRTPLAFYEMWPPDRFPVTFYPSPAYWALDTDQVSGEHLEARLMIVSATALAWEPARSVVRDALALPGDRRRVVDLDHRPMLWADSREAPLVVGGVIRHADVVIGSEAEFEALDLDIESIAAEREIYLKRGDRGARFVGRDRVHDVPAIEVDVLSGLGAGDGFAAAVAEGLARHRDPSEIVRRANAAGAIVATRPTCSDSMPTNVEIDELLEAQAVAR